MTSRWLVEVARQRAIAIDWRSLSLALLHEGKDVPGHSRADMEASRRAHRVVEALRSDGRNDHVGDLYREYGRRVHVGGRSPNPEAVQEAAVAAGIEDVARSVADDASWDDAVRASHSEAQELAGPGAGSPVLFREAVDRATFGPIVSPSPVGADAARLWEALVSLGELPQFYELKRPRRSRPEISPTLL